MTHPIRSFLALATLMVVLAACSTTAGAPTSEAPLPSEPAPPSVEPSLEPSVEPSVALSDAPADEERQVAGTITQAEMAFSGPGGTIAEAIAGGDSGEYPNLVNGVIFRDTDGTIYIAASVSDLDAPTFDGPMLEVLNIDNDGPSWDMAYAEDIGLQEANGILFRQSAQVLGFLDVK